MQGRTLSRYAVLEKLGEGGMGVVHKARDLKLDRFVALKFLSADLLGSSEQVARLEQEALVISSLNHPHIATIYDFEEAEGLRFLVLEYFPGGSLRSRLEERRRAGRRFSLGEIISYSFQIGSALSHAHRWGIVHRDFKPGNVMFTAEGDIKLTDFGLAKWRASGAGSKSGAVMGTPAYLSPEQARREELDHRADIFSLGVMLFELAAGEPPFQAENEAAVVYQIVHAPTPSLQQLRPDFPKEYEQIVKSALEKDRGLRYQSVDQLLTDLRSLEQALASTKTREEAPGTGQHQQARPASAAIRDWIHRLTGKGQDSRGERLAAEPASASVRRLGDKPEQSQGERSISSIAVLPFANLGADPKNEYFGAGLAEELIHALMRLEGLRVVAPASAFQLRGKDYRFIGEQLGVDAVLEGSVRTARDLFRITAKLVNVSDGAYRWSGAYERSAEDVFTTQEEIAQAIVKELQGRLSGGIPPKLVKRHTENVAAYHLYLEGRYYWNKQTPEALEKCVRCFEAAIGHDPAYALAYAGIADAYNLLGTWAVMPPREAILKAKAAALKARELDEKLAEVHTPLGFIRSVFDRDWAEAEREYRMAIECNPGYPVAHHAYAMSYLLPAGRLDEAVAEMHRALDLDPISLFINANLGLVHHMARRYEDALKQHQKTLELEPGFYLAHWYRGWTLEQLGKLEKAIDELQQGSAASGNSPFIVGSLGHAYALHGNEGEARKLLEEMQTASKQRYVSPFAFALIHLGLGDTEATFHWLDRACENNTSWLVLLNVDPLFESLRPDPRFQALLEKTGLHELGKN